jgi:hypothetical protein
MGAEGLKEEEMSVDDVVSVEQFQGWPIMIGADDLMSDSRLDEDR